MASNKHVPIKTKTKTTLCMKIIYIICKLYIQILFKTKNLYSTITAPNFQKLFMEKTRGKYSRKYKNHFLKVSVLLSLNHRLPTTSIPTTHTTRGVAEQGALMTHCKKLSKGWEREGRGFRWCSSLRTRTYPINIRLSPNPCL